MVNNMKTKAFTLIELLGVILILSVVSFIGFSGLTNMLKTNKQKEFNNFKENLYIATQSYIELNKNTLTNIKNNSGVILINVQTLYDEGYIKIIPVNPKTEKSASNDQIKVTNNNNILNFEYIEVNQ